MATTYHYLASIDGFFSGIAFTHGETRDEAMCEAIIVADENAVRWAYSAPEPPAEFFARTAE